MQHCHADVPMLLSLWSSVQGRRQEGRLDTGMRICTLQVQTVLKEWRMCGTAMLKS